MSIIDWLKRLWRPPLEAVAPAPTPPAIPSPTAYPPGSPKFQKAVKSVLRWEGGLVDNPKDPGGITNYGISLKWLHSVDPAATADTVRQLTAQKAIDLYHQHFWIPAYDQLLSDDVATYVMDMAVNMGPKEAAEIAQQASGIAADGVFGSFTVAACNVKDPDVLLDSLKELRRQFYEHLVRQKPVLAEFMPNWLKRTEEVA